MQDLSKLRSKIKSQKCSIHSPISQFSSRWRNLVKYEMATLKRQIKDLTKEVEDLKAIIKKSSVI
jgi:predicted  nucleic acid-binding Zn-ribbon protein